MIVRSLNSLDQGAPVTYLSNDEAAGTTTIRVKNSTGLTTSWAIQVGKTGEDRTEVVIGTATNIGTIGVSALSFPHPTDTPVSFVKYDKVVFEKSAAGTAGTASPITDGTITYQADALDQQTGQSYTQFDDTAGTTTDAYRTYFRNSVLAVNSTESDWITSAGFSFYSLGKMRQRVREKLWDSNFAADGEINDWINEWKDELTNSLISVNEDYAIGTVDVAFGTNGLGTVTTTDFKQPKRIEVTYNGSDFFLSTKRELNDYAPNEVVNSAHPYHNWQGNTVLHVMPSDSAGTARVYFYRTGSPLVNDTDEVDLPMRAYTRSFVDYAVGMAYQKDGKPKEADRKFGDAYGQKLVFTQQLAPRDKSSQTYVKMEEVLSGEDNLIV